MVYCSECGQQCIEGAKFCGQCGTAVMQPTPAGRPGKLSFYEAFHAFDRDGSGTLTADELVGSSSPTSISSGVSSSGTSMCRLIDDHSIA